MPNSAKRPPALLAVFLVSLLLAASAQASPLPVSISANDGSTCSAMNTGTVDCWGKDYITGAIHTLPTPYPGLAAVTRVSTGFHYNCALLVGGIVECWGDGSYGQLGNGQTNDSGVPVVVSGITGARAISAGGFHACALLAGGEVACWGRNMQGALGNGTLVNSSVPVRVVGIKRAVAISAGFEWDESCAVLSSGQVDCWGANEHGQLGNGTEMDSWTPVAVKGITNATGVAAAGAHACAVLATGGVDCWGHNNEGQLGNGTTLDSAVPVTVLGVTGGRAVGVAPRGYSCALVKQGNVYCWGRNPKYQLGRTSGNTHLAEPALVTGATSITTAMGHACSLLASGGAACWGYDDYGQLGKGGGEPKMSPLVLVEYPGIVGASEPLTGLAPTPTSEAPVENGPAPRHDVPVQAGSPAPGEPGSDGAARPLPPIGPTPPAGLPEASPGALGGPELGLAAGKLGA